MFIFSQQPTIILTFSSSRMILAFVLHIQFEKWSVYPTAPRCIGTAQYAQSSRSDIMYSTTACRAWPHSVSYLWYELLNFPFKFICKISSNPPFGFWKTFQNHFDYYCVLKRNSWRDTAQSDSVISHTAEESDSEQYHSARSLTPCSITLRSCLPSWSITLSRVWLGSVSRCVESEWCSITLHRFSGGAVSRCLESDLVQYHAA